MGVLRSQLPHSSDGLGVNVKKSSTRLMKILRQAFESAENEYDVEIPSGGVVHVRKNPAPGVEVRVTETAKDGGPSGDTVTAFSAGVDMPATYPAGLPFLNGIPMAVIESGPGSETTMCVWDLAEGSPAKGWGERLREEVGALEAMPPVSELVEEWKTRVAIREGDPSDGAQAEPPLREYANRFRDLLSEDRLTDLVKLWTPHPEQAKRLETLTNQLLSDSLKDGWTLVDGPAESATPLGQNLRLHREGKKREITVVAFGPTGALMLRDSPAPGDRPEQ